MLSVPYPLRHPLSPTEKDPGPLVGNRGLRKFSVRLLDHPRLTPSTELAHPAPAGRRERARQGERSEERQRRCGHFLHRHRLSGLPLRIRPHPGVVHRRHLDLVPGVVDEPLNGGLSHESFVVVVDPIGTRRTVLHRVAGDGRGALFRLVPR